MIDALLYAVRDGVRAAKFGYGVAECEIMPDGHPPPRCGTVFVAVHGGRSRPGPANQRNLDEMYGYSVTVTTRIAAASLDRAGDQIMARNLALVPVGLRQGHDAKVQQLKTFLHSNWAMVVLQSQTPNSANDNLAAWCTGTVYGFCEPVRWQGPDEVRLVGSEWFTANEEPTDGDDRVGIVTEMRFDGAHRFQPQTAAVGQFV